MKRLSRLFWIAGLALGVFTFAAMSLGSFVWAIHDRDWSPLLGSLVMAGFAAKSFELLDARIYGPPPVVETLEIDF